MRVSVGRRSIGCFIKNVINSLGEKFAKSSAVRSAMICRLPADPKSENARGCGSSADPKPADVESSGDRNFDDPQTSHTHTHINYETIDQLVLLNLCHYLYLNADVNTI